MMADARLEHAFVDDDATSTASPRSQNSHIGTDLEKNAHNEEEGFLVSWTDAQDPQNPQNWSTSRRIGITLIWIVTNICTAITSSIYSSGSTLIAQEFDKSSTVVVLGVSLYLVGYTVGPPFWGPLSEKFGRKWPMIIGMSGFTLFCLPVALGKNIETLIIGRFLCGAFGASPLSIAGGGLVDMWDPVSRGVALACCIGCIFGTPVLAPVIGDFVAQSHLGWRWDNWLSAIMGLASVVLVVFCLPETFAPVLLKRKAAWKRKSTSDDRYHSAFDNESKSVTIIVKTYLIRPFRKYI